jgi:hypothetical protein
MSTSRRPRWIHVALYLGLSLLLVQLHGEMVNFGPKAGKRAERHEQILQGEGASPWAYRLAVPWMAEASGAVVELAGLPERRATELAYLFWRWVFTFGLFLLFHRYLGHWVPPPYPLLGTLLLAGLHGPAFAHYWFQPASSLDLLLWTAAAVITLEGRWPWILPLMLLGGINRETSVFIVLIHGALCWGRVPLGALLPRVAALAVAWALPFGAVRVLVGSAEWSHALPALGMLPTNLGQPAWLLYAACLWGVLWVLPALRWRALPPRLRALVLVMLPYLALQLYFGRIREVRLLLPMGLALIPVLLLALRDEGRRETA